MHYLFNDGHTYTQKKTTRYAQFIYIKRNTKKIRIMKDLQKMKADQENEFRMAVIGNQLEERFHTPFQVLERIKGDGLRIIAKSVGKYGINGDTIDMTTAALLLSYFPADEPQPLNASATNPKGDIFGLYRVRVNRGFRAAFTSLNVEWLHGDNDFEITLKIDGNDALEPFFKDSMRKMDTSERDTYKPIRRGHLVREMDLPIKSFKCAAIRYAGGYESATDLDAINTIIETIKNAK